MNNKRNVIKLRVIEEFYYFHPEFPESLASDSKGRDSRYKTRNRLGIGLVIWGFTVSDSESDSRI